MRTETELLKAIVTSLAWEDQGHGHGHIEIVDRQTFEEAALEAAQLVGGDPGA